MAPPGPRRWCADRTTGRLRLPGGARLPDGDAETPALAFDNGSGVGLFRPASGQMGFATGGVQRALLGGTALQLDVPLTGAAVTASATDTTAGPGAAGGGGLAAARCHALPAGEPSGHGQPERGRPHRRGDQSAAATGVATMSALPMARRSAPRPGRARPRPRSAGPIPWPLPPPLVSPARRRLRFLPVSCWTAPPRPRPPAFRCATSWMPAGPIPCG